MKDISLQFQQIHHYRQLDPETLFVDLVAARGSAVDLLARAHRVRLVTVQRGSVPAGGHRRHHVVFF